MYVRNPVFSRYEVSREGTIRAIGSVKSIPPTKSGGSLVVNLKSDSGTWKTTSVSRLILMTFAPLRDAWKYPYAYVEYEDGNSDNTHVDNLRWAFRDYIPRFVSGVNCFDTTLVDIPGWAFRYQINLRGEIFDKKSGKGKTGFLTNGYLYTDLYTQEGKPVRKGIHRLIALTFLRHPIDCDHLVINHKDGNPLNNVLSNLEWCTYSDNISHAYETGLREENVAVIAKSTATGKCYEFRSFGEAARFIGATPPALHYWMTGRRDICPYKGYLFKTGSDTRPWPVTVDEGVFSRNQPVRIRVTDITTNQSQEFPTLTRAAASAGTSTSTILKYVFGKKKGVVYKSRYLFSSPDGDVREIRKVTVTKTLPNVVYSSPSN